MTVAHSYGRSRIDVDYEGDYGRSPTWPNLPDSLDSAPKPKPEPTFGLSTRRNSPLKFIKSSKNIEVFTSLQYRSVP